MSKSNPNPGTRSGQPFVRIRIGDKDVFAPGDGHLLNCSTELAEGAGSSNTKFEIYDRGRVLTDKYFTYINKEGGLDPVILPSPKNKSTKGGSTPGDLKDFNGDKIAFMIDYYLSNGFSKYGTAAIIGNAMQESGLNPSVPGTDQGAAGTPGASEGILQWTFERKAGMPATFEGQVAFAVTEMQRDGGAIAAHTYQVLQDPNASKSQVQSAVQSWIRWGTEGSRWSYAEEALKKIESSGKTSARTSQEKASEPTKEQPKQTAQAKVGSQITVELGFDGKTIAAYSFLHTSIDFDMFSPDKLAFGGQAAAWILSERKKNTAYSNVTLKQVATRICGNYGLKLDMKEEGAKYEYFPQRGATDYEALLIECRRVGYRVQCKGNTLHIGARVAKDTGFTLSYGENMGMSFSVSHKAEGESSGGARSSDPSDKSSTGQRKWAVDGKSGQLVQLVAENDQNAGKGAKSSTTGNHLAMLAPVTDGSTDDADKTRQANEKRVKGIVASWSAPTTPEMLLLDPDCVFRTEGITKFLDRIWTIESIKHEWDGGKMVSSGTLYSPLKNKYPTPTDGAGGAGGVNLPDGCRGKVAQAAIDYKGTGTSAEPGNGTQACVYAVNRVFEKAGVPTPWGASEYVPTAEDAMIAQGTLVKSGDEQPGDIVIAGNTGHIGIVIGKDSILSNSSSARAFVWGSDIDFDGSLGGKSRVYRLDC